MVFFTQNVDLNTMDTSLLKNPIYRVQIVTLIVSLVNIGFTGHSYLPTISEEAYLAYLFCIVICFVLTLLWTAANLLGLFNSVHENSPAYKIVELLLYTLVILFYSITLICYLVSILHHGKSVGRFWERIVALILGVFNTLLYGFILFKIFQKSKWALFGGIGCRVLTGLRLDYYETTN